MAQQRDHPLGKKARIPITALANETLIMFVRKISQISFGALVSACTANGSSPRVLLEVRSVATQFAFLGMRPGNCPNSIRIEKITPDSGVIRPLNKNIEVRKLLILRLAKREDRQFNHDHPVEKAMFSHEE